MQEQLTRLINLRELIVQMARPLRKAKRLRRLPLLVFAHRAHHSAEVGLPYPRLPIADSTAPPGCMCIDTDTARISTLASFRCGIVETGDVNGTYSRCNCELLAYCFGAVQAGCGLRSSPEADIFVGGATAPLFFPDRFDGHGYAT